MPFCFTALFVGDYLPFVDLGDDFELNDARAGNAFVCATNSDGNMKCWGQNTFGHLGLGISVDEDIGDESGEMGDNLDYVDLGDCTMATTAMASGCGGHHSAIVCDDLSVYAWGKNDYGQLGNEDDTVAYTGAESSDMGDNLVAIRNDRPPTGSPTIDPTPAPTTIDQPYFSVGEYQTCMAYENGTKCWGRNDVMDPSYRGGAVNYTTQPPIDYFDLGDADGDFDVYQVRCGKMHTCAFTFSGYARCWGSNGFGQLGYGNTNYFAHSGNKGYNIDLGSGVLVYEWSAGEYFNCILTGSNTIKCFGRNQYGQLGIGSSTNVGDSSNQMGNYLEEIDFGTGWSPTKMAVGAGHGCAIYNYAVKCWGRNDYGQLGYGDTDNRGDDSGEMGDDLDEVSLGSTFYAWRIVLGDYYTCVISTSMTMKCFGRNEYGQLGQGNTDDIGDDSDEMGDNLAEIDLGDDFTLNDVKCSSGFICASNSDGEIKCWGRNDDGQLGYGDTDHRGDGSGEMGDDLPVLDLGSGASFQNVELPSGYGGSHSSLISDDLDIKAWGNNDYGQCGSGDSTQGTNIGDESGEMGDNLPEVDMDRDPTVQPTEDPTAVPTTDPSPAPTTLEDQPLFSFNKYHSCMAYDDDVKCWGQNSYSDPAWCGGNVNYTLQPPIAALDIGSADGLMNVSDVRCGLKHTCAISPEGNARCWGMFTFYSVMRSHVQLVSY